MEDLRPQEAEGQRRDELGFSEDDESQWGCVMSVFRGMSVFTGTF